MTSLLPWPSWMLEADWPELTAVTARCLDLAGRGELPNTLMLLGNPGLGREALAIELAAGMICHGGPPGGCACQACQRVRRGIHPDLEIIAVAAGKSDISIDQAREVIGGLNRRPFEGQHRIVLLTSCQTLPLGHEAASALLKSLEEPPSQLTFLMLAANPERVLPTILSRSVQVRVPPPPTARLVGLVSAACDTDAARAATLLAACRGDGSTALAIGDPTLAAVAEKLDRLLPATLGGDGESLVRVAGLIQRTPEGLALALASLLRLAATEEAEGAERYLAAAAALLAGEPRRAALRLDTDSMVLGALSPFATGTA